MHICHVYWMPIACKSFVKSYLWFICVQLNWSNKHEMRILQVYCLFWSFFKIFSFVCIKQRLHHLSLYHIYFTWITCTFERKQTKGRQVYAADTSFGWNSFVVYGLQSPNPILLNHKQIQKNIYMWQWMWLYKVHWILTSNNRVKKERAWPCILK